MASNVDLSALTATATGTLPTSAPIGIPNSASTGTLPTSNLAGASHGNTSDPYDWFAANPLPRHTPYNADANPANVTSTWTGYLPSSTTSGCMPSLVTSSARPASRGASYDDNPNAYGCFGGGLPTSTAPLHASVSSTNDRSGVLSTSNGASYGNINDPFGYYGGGLPTSMAPFNTGINGTNNSSGILRTSAGPSHGNMNDPYGYYTGGSQFNNTVSTSFGSSNGQMEADLPEYRHEPYRGPFPEPPSAGGDLASTTLGIYNNASSDDNNVPSNGRDALPLDNFGSGNTFDGYPSTPGAFFGLQAVLAEQNTGNSNCVTMDAENWLGALDNSLAQYQAEAHHPVGSCLDE